jgi:predicted nucleic acid-binding protein
MTTVFVDTFYFLALVNPRDQAHARALAFTAAFQGQMLTTVWVLAEFGDAMSDPRNRLEFIATLNDIRANPQMTIVPPDQALFDEGVQFYANRLDKEWSLTDCISFVVMQREGITDALTGDHHFEQAGFVALLK